MIRMLSALLILALAGLPAQAKLPFLKKAQGMGFSEIKTCQSCHAGEKPAKDGPMTERGQYLKAQKAARKADQVDLAWLKDYKGK
ncbi:MAG: hypothetical protein Q8K67_05095 [Geothrix sp.]|nr:hypothetical protein [Geothrix sp.]